MDLTGLTIAVAVGGLLVALGVGIDSLLLDRHVKTMDDIALKWWLFFDNLRMADIPRIAVALYLRGKIGCLAPSSLFLFSSAHSFSVPSSPS